METRQELLRATVREGYQILLRAEVELALPEGKQKMAAFYQRMGETCWHWARDIYGERLRKDFSALCSVREKSAFRTQHYRM